MTITLKGKENFKKCVRGEKPEYIGLRSDCMNFCPHIIPDNIARAFVLEKEKWEGEIGGKDMFGIDWEYVPTVGGSMVKPGNPLLKNLHDWENFVSFPNIESWDWEGSAVMNNDWLENSGKFVQFWIFTGLFERMISWMDFENAALMLVDEDYEDDVHNVLDKLADLYCDIICHVRKFFPAVDSIYFHDDWGAQRAPFFSPATNREFIAPALKKIVDCCHENDMIFDLHSCGKTELMTPVMIECGVDMWCGQPMNDKVALVEKFGDKIFIGTHEPFSGPKAKPVPDSDEVLYKELEEFLAPFKATGKRFYVANMQPIPRVINAYKEITSHWFV